MDREEGKKKSLQIANRARVAMLGTNGTDGYPNIKALLKAKNDGLNKFWFSTNASSKRVKQLQENNKACIYFANKILFKGLMLVGDIEICDDLETKKRFWKKGDKQYYPLGVEDPDYVILCFTARWGNYYSMLKNVSFDIL